MTWLSGWDKRIKLVTSSFWVDEDLIDFPVMIQLTSDTGRSNTDVTDIFDELTVSSGSSITWNPDDKSSTLVLSNGNLSVLQTASNVWEAVRSTTSKSSGKWYWETTIDVASGPDTFVGIGTASEILDYPGITSAGYGYYGSNGDKYNGGATSYGVSYTAGDVIGVALDLDNGKIWWSKNGAWQAGGNPAAGTGEAYSGITGTYYAMDAWYNINNESTANFGGSAFSYIAPAGFSSGLYTAEDNRKKIAVTTMVSGVETELYTEIERWDWVNQEAWLWTKVPMIYGSVDTTLYLYYDLTQVDNTYYIGDTGDLAATTAWDSNFVGVWHMSQYPSDGSGAIKDSTTSVSHGTSAGSMPLIDGKIGNGIDFDGINDNIGCGSAAVLDDIGTITIEGTFKADDWGESSSGRVISKSDATNQNGWNLFVQSPSSENRFGFTQGWNTTDGIWFTPNASISTNSWYYGVAQYDRSFGTGDKPTMYLNGVSKTVTTSQTPVGTIETDAAQSVCIAARAATDREFDGIIDEVRISNTIRSAAWIKATYYNNFDDFLTYSMEVLPQHYFSGYTQLESVATGNRTLYAYRRDTGAYIGTTTSSGDGGFTLLTTYSGSHFVVALDDDAAPSYNEVVVGNVIPLLI